MTDLDLTGRVALVTGATAGLGTRFAHVLAQAGAAVAVTGTIIKVDDGQTHR